ncbi:unnamed protein product [Cylicocyclus nassatus]|uniref:Uncharacterized protein n=1 Tax=Cylicocyclus nassatus TaxID=53992 RepID=A0AA36MCC7_CYLNA|nr:unnamed protein product [Cylicocyclus nassatus]
MFGRNIAHLLWTNVLVLYARYTIKDCGQSKVCVRAPPGCNGVDDCTVIFSFRGDGAEVELELLGKPPTEPSEGFGHISAIISDDQTLDHGIVYFCARCKEFVKGGLGVKTSQGLRQIGVSEHDDEGLSLTATSTDNLLYCKTRQAEDVREAFFLENFTIALATGTFSEIDLCRENYAKDVYKSSSTSSRSTEQEHRPTTAPNEAAIASAFGRLWSTIAPGKFVCTLFENAYSKTDNQSSKQVRDLQPNEMLLDHFLSILIQENTESTFWMGASGCIITLQPSRASYKRPLSDIRMPS